MQALQLMVIAIWWFGKLKLPPILILVGTAEATLVILNLPAKNFANCVLLISKPNV